jgi:hypothetical protein
MSYSAEILADAPVAYLRLGDASGTSAADSSGNGHTGTINAANTRNRFGLMAGDAGTCTKFNAAGGEMAASADFNFGTGDFAIECIITTTQQDAGAILFTGNIGTNTWFAAIVSGKLRFFTGSNYTSTAYVNDGRPHHVVVRRSGTTLTIRIDGALDSTFTNSDTLGNSTTAQGIGGWDNSTSSQYWTGKIQELAFYKGTVPSAARFDAHYAAMGGIVTLVSDVSGVKAGKAAQTINLTGTGTSWVQGVTTFTAQALTLNQNGVVANNGSITSTIINSGTSATLTYTSPEIVTISTKVTLADPDSRSVQLDITVPYTIASPTVSGAATAICVPDGYDSGAGAHLILYHHGSGEDQTVITNQSLLVPGIVNVLCANGWIVAAIATAPSGWGNDSSVALYDAMDSYLTGNYTIKKRIVWGISMGGIASLRRAKTGTIPNLVGYLGHQFACDILDIYDNSSLDFKPAISSAWGVADRPALVTAISGKNPVGFSGTSFVGQSMRFYASPADTVVPKATNSDAMQAIVSPYAVESDVVVCSGAHGDISHFQASDVLSFVTRAVGTSGPSGPPTLDSATIETDGETLTLVFSRDVTGVDDGYSLSGGHTLSGADGSGDTWTFDVSGIVFSDEDLTLDYSGTSTVDLEDEALAPFSDFAVDNNSTQVINVTPSPLTLERGQAGQSVSLTGSNTHFDINTTVTISAGSVSFDVASHTIINAVIHAPDVIGDVTLTITQEGPHHVFGPTLTVQDTIDPTFLSATLGRAGDHLTVLFSEPMTEGSSPGAAWSLAGTSAVIGDGDISGAIGTFPLSPAAAKGDAITLDYTPGGVADAASNLLGAVSGAAVVNHTGLRKPGNIAAKMLVLGIIG